MQLIHCGRSIQFTLGATRIIRDANRNLREEEGERERKGCSIHLAFLDRPPRSVMQEPNRPPEIASSDCVKFDFNARNIPTHYVYLNAIYFSLFFFIFHEDCVNQFPKTLGSAIEFIKFCYCNFHRMRHVYSSGG